jgi:pilus assembly protein Flp/PilA
MASKTNVWSTAARDIGRLLVDERGATAIEYALIASGIGAAIMTIVFGVGQTVVNNLYNRIASAL